MSRSIHTTNRSLDELKKRKFASEEARQAALDEARTELRRKRRIKRFVGKERRAVPPEGQPTPVGVIPVNVTETGDYIFHAAAVDDVRAVLAALPPTAVEGIDEIRLLLGKDYMTGREAADQGMPDPHTGRPGYMMFPGAYAGDILGTFRPRRGVISLHAYVVDPDRLQVPQAIVGLFLRLQALKTLMHEIAHFHDHAARVHRGRWLADRRENLEWYAEKMEHEWTEKIVVPYLERTYAKECRAFRAWVRQRGGLALSLGFFAGDTRHTGRHGPMRAVYSTAGAFENWLEELPRCGSRPAAQLALASELHNADQYPESLAIFDLILQAEAHHLTARVRRADTLIHLERIDEALAEADAVIRVAPTEHGAWSLRALVLEGRKDWAGLLETCGRWAHVQPMPARARASCHRHWAIAHCALGDLDAMEASLAAFANAIRSKDPEAAQRRLLGARRAVFRRAKKPLPEEVA